jgi:hypothetical protein
LRSGTARGREEPLVALAAPDALKLAEGVMEGGRPPQTPGEETGTRRIDVDDV